MSGLGRITKLRTFPRDQRYKKSVTEKRSYKVIHLWAICFAASVFVPLGPCRNIVGTLSHTQRRKWRKMLTVSVSIHRFGKEPEVAQKRSLEAPAGGKINNMAVENIEGVFLTPGDIAGAAVKDQEIG